MIFARTVPEVIAVLDATVGFEQVADRQVGGGFAVGDRAALQPQPALRVVGVEELVDQARFAHAGLAEERHHLPLAALRALQRLVQRGQLRLPAHKAGESTGDGRLQAPTDGAGPN